VKNVGAVGGRNFASPIDKAHRLYNSLLLPHKPWGRLEQRSAWDFIITLQIYYWVCVWKNCDIMQLCQGYGKKLGGLCLIFWTTLYTHKSVTLLNSFNVNESARHQTTQTMLNVWLIVKNLWASCLKVQTDERCSTYTKSSFFFDNKAFH